MTTDPHYYLSTACLHGLHDECRKVCKFCANPCVCPCHIGPDVRRMLGWEEATDE